MKKRYVFVLLFLSLCFILLFKYYISFFIFTTEATKQDIGVSVLVDTFAPDLIITSPTNTTYTTSSIDLNYSVTDSASGVNTTWFNLDNGDNITITSNYTIRINTSKDYTIYVFANDSAGLENNSEYVTFHVLMNKTVIFTEYTGSQTTNFSLYNDEQLEDMSGVVLHAQFGKITFLENINISDITTDLDANGDISYNNIYINTGNLPNFNKPATLQLYNLTFTNPRIMMDGSVCPASTCTKESYVGNTLTFNVTGMATYSAEETPAEQPTPGPGGGGGGGGGGRTVAYPEFNVEPEVIKVKLMPGDQAIRKFTVKNIGEKEFSFNLDISIQRDLAMLTEDAITLAPGSSEEISLFFNIDRNIQPGIYTGKVTVDSEGIKKQVLLVVEVESLKRLMDVKLVIPEEYKVVIPGNSVYGTIELFNMGPPGRIDVNLKFGVKDFDNNTISSESSVVAVETRASMVRQVFLPLDIKKGHYIMFVEAYYDGTIATSTDEFDVIEELPTIAFVRSPYLLLGALLILLAIILIIIILFKLVRRLRSEKKGEKDVRIIIRDITSMVNKADQYLKEGDLESSKMVYMAIKPLYDRLSESDKRKVIDKVRLLYSKIVGKGGLRR